MPRNVVTPRGAAVRVEGLPELQEKISALIDKATAEECKKIWMQAGLELRDAARDFAPVAPEPITYYKAGQEPRKVEPGALRASIFAAYGDPEEQNILVGVNDRIAPHGWMVEFGTVKMAPKPYMRPALTLMRTRCVEIIADGYRKILVENGSISEPSAPGGQVDPPTVTEALVQRVRGRAAARFNRNPSTARRS